MCVLCIVVCFWAFWVALVVKNPPAIAGDMRWEDPLEEGMATHSGIFAWRAPWTENLVGYGSWVANSQTQLEQLSTHELPQL